MMKAFFAVWVAAALLAAVPAAAQDSHQQHQDHQGHGQHGAGQGTTHGAEGHASHGVVTSPADGAMTNGAPEWFTATFEHPMRLTAVTVTTGDQAPVTVPVAASAPTTRVAARLPRLAAGNHVLNWTAEGADGHRMTGVVRFMVH